MKFKWNVLTLVSLLTTCSMAASTISIDIQGGIRPGSPYVATVESGKIGMYNTGDSFTTFCLERNEQFQEGVEYNVAISDKAINGGIGGGSPDYLSGDTAWLYTEFGKGNYQNVLAMQWAVWTIEEEVVEENLAQEIDKYYSGQNAQSDDWKKALFTETDSYLQDANKYGWGDNIGNVRVMNLTDMKTGEGRQDVLVVVVPTPGAILLTGLGTILVSITRRKRLG